MAGSRRLRQPKAGQIGVIGLGILVAIGLLVFGIHAATASSGGSSSGAGSAANQPAAGGSRPLAGGSYAGSLVLDDSGADLSSWASARTCTANDYQPDGSVGTDASGDVVLTTTGGPNSCAALASPGTYSSGVFEAEIDLPAYPGRSSAVANWDAFWLTNAAVWPTDGELDAVESEPPTGVNGVSWHSGTGTRTASFNVSTHNNTLPIDSTNLAPGWHTIDVVYARGFFAVYYDGSLYTRFASSEVTGDPLTIYFTTDVYPSAWNADSSPATLKMRYLKVWSYK